ncbi:cytochrome c3 family protein [Haliangium ochraceum]|uniref:Doubled CXXCH motif domain-containing protein n=1 Tax=Haliangium ochraceum (strain DSM 14365 / JCM 11303 / SMP-2) TaxID=502025 RepID=D0LKK9_HALO1|nr:cytochrome c3 family protein [Haliangium ochraceum]ACY15057.1 hypothetical protein Hoch_2521 [Haliangium ochraceum DSM 14365]
MSKPLRIALVAAALLCVAGIAAAAWFTPQFYARELAMDLPLGKAEFATSTQCRSCHPDQYRSWHRTFHRTMTQEASAQAVRGRFDGQPVTYWGLTIRPYQQDGRYFFEYLDPPSGERLRTMEIVRTVGSRRYQQYLGMHPDREGVYLRLELLWHIEDERWVHMNGAFLGHDDNGFSDNVAVWNSGCIVCHNTGPVPGALNYNELVERFKSGQDASAGRHLTYDSQVSELGIACASCHSPGSVHAKRNRNPFRRYLLYLTGQSDNTIVNPDKLDQQRSVDVCGQCHGQRLPKSLGMVVTWAETGPTFRAGDLLDEHVDVLARDSEPLTNDQNGDLFTRRFWQDGTPRLTAYELQGIRQSACYQKGTLTCQSCHTMHGGDVYGQLPPEHRTAAACAGCHERVVADVAAHTRHAADSSGSDCFACHMPKMVYGVMEIHRSHHIEVPHPMNDGDKQRPNACTSCHLDRSITWAAREAHADWPARFQEPPAGEDVAYSLASLLGGDPVERGVAARLAGRDDTPLTPQQRALLVPHLITAMKRDRYPAVRRFAAKSLAALDRELAAGGIELGMGDALADFDFIGPAEERAGIAAALEQRWAQLPKSTWPPPPPAMLLDGEFQPLREPVEALIERAAERSQEINIGE